MTTQQTDALQCAADLEYSIARHGMQDAFTLNAYRAMKMVRTQHARIADLEARLEAIGACGVSGPLVGQPQAVPDLSQLTERGAQAWAGVDAQGRPEGFTAADMATAAAQGFRDGVASLTAQAADLRTTFSEMLVDLPNTEPFTLFKAGFDAALAAGQATAAQPAAQQGAAYAALPTSSYAGRVYEEGFLIGTCPLYTADQLHAFADATHTLRASRGQAPATQQAGATKEHVRLVRVIADKIEDGTLFRSGIYSNKDLARFVRNVADAAAPKFPTTQAQADSVPAQSGLTDAYVGAREDLSIWKRRALEAEATVRNFVREANSPTFMGDPASDECHHGDAFQGAT